MGWYRTYYEKYIPEKEENAPRAKGWTLLFETVWRERKELVKLNLIYLFFCLPVVTIPAATCAMFQIVWMMVTDEPYLLWIDFFETFKTKWKRATVYGWGYLTVIALLIWYLYIYSGFLAYHRIFLVPYFVVAAVGFLFVLSGGYLCAYLVETDLAGLRLFKAVLYTTVAFFPRATLAAIANGALWIVCAENVVLFLPAAALVLFSLSALNVAFAARPVFMKKNEDT